jgi:hypothetical protein
MVGGWDKTAKKPRAPREEQEAVSNTPGFLGALGFLAVFSDQNNNFNPN